MWQTKVTPDHSDVRFRFVSISSFTPDRHCARHFHSVTVWCWMKSEINAEIMRLFMHWVTAINENNFEMRRSLRFFTLFSFFVRLDYNFFSLNSLRLRIVWVSFSLSLILKISHSICFISFQTTPSLSSSTARENIWYILAVTHTRVNSQFDWNLWIWSVPHRNAIERIFFFLIFWSFPMSATWHIVWCVDKMVFLSEMRNLLPKQSFFWLPETGGRRGKWRKMDESNSTLCWNEPKREERNEMKFLANTDSELNVDRLFDTRGSLKCQRNNIE